MSAKKSSRTTSKSTKKTNPAQSSAKKPAVKARTVQKSSEVVNPTPVISPAVSNNSAQFTSPELQKSTTNETSKARRAHSKLQFLSLFKNPQAQNVLISVISGTISVCAVLWFALGFIPMVYDQTEDAQKASSSLAAVQEEKAKEAEKAELQKLIEQENNSLSFTNQQARLSTNLGDIRVKLLDQNAPKTVENFVRLTSRGKYTDVAFHRLVKQESFAVLQGGDYELQTGFGGKSAFGQFFEDELWQVQPEFNETGSVTNDPVFRGGQGYTNYNKERNFVTIPKGYVAMANSGANTNGSQFFIILKDTQLPANYTVFAQVFEEDFAVLDKIYNEVQTTANDSGTADDKPATEVLLISAEII